jgi:transketolase
MTSQVPHVGAIALADRALSVKKRFLAMYEKAHAGHIGSSLSCAEILVLLQFGWMRRDDVLVLSKGHAAAALYSVLAESGALTADQIDSFYAEGTQLPALPPVNAIRQIPFATGSLGHGLSLSAGMALGARLDGRDRRYYCVTSDGELDEGSVWEAALFIAHHRLASVVWIIDRNQLQGIGRTEDVLALEPLDAKLRAFGFHVVSADGHDFEALLAARDECASLIEAGRAPVAIIAHTKKGNGIEYLQDTIDSHYLPMNRQQYEQALDDITGAHAAARNGAGRAR